VAVAPPPPPSPPPAPRRHLALCTAALRVVLPAAVRVMLLFAGDGMEWTCRCVCVCVFQRESGEWGGGFAARLARSLPYRQKVAEGRLLLLEFSDGTVLCGDNTTVQQKTKRWARGDRVVERFRSTMHIARGMIALYIYLFRAKNCCDGLENMQRVSLDAFENCCGGGDDIRRFRGGTRERGFTVHVCVSFLFIFYLYFLNAANVQMKV
jgi:hypothetical protein